MVVSFRDIGYTIIQLPELAIFLNELIKGKSFTICSSQIQTSALTKHTEKSPTHSCSFQKQKDKDYVVNLEMKMKNLENSLLKLNKNLSIMNEKIDRKLM